MTAQTTTALPVIDETVLAAARARRDEALRSFEYASECGYVTKREHDEIARRYRAAERALLDVTMPAALRARRFVNPITQYAENERVERIALAMAARDEMAYSFLPCWIVDGVDDSEIMMAWPNGEICTEREYEDEMRAKRLAANPWL